MNSKSSLLGLAGKQTHSLVLADCNNFYCSVERVFNPKLNGRPVVVLSNGDGCIVARSNEAKKLGLQMGQPYFEARPVIEREGVAVYSSNYTLYASFQNRIMEVLSSFTPRMEVYSIDEAFLSFEGMTDARERVEYARRIQATVKRWTGIPISIGIAPSKTLTKLVNERAKKEPEHEGVLDWAEYAPWEIETLLVATPVEDIWGINTRRGRTLRQHGIETAYDLAHAPDGLVRQLLGVVGLRTTWELRGISCLPLELAPPDKKAIASSKTFSRAVTSLIELREAVATYLSRAAEKLREQEGATGLLNLFVTTGHFTSGPQHYSNSITLKLPIPTAYTPDLVRYAWYGLDKLYRPGYAYRKAGMLLTDISSTVTGTPHQGLDLWGEATPQKLARHQSLMKALDDINHTWGRETLRLGASGLQREWFMQQSHVSARFTTRWNELLTV